MKLKMSKAGRNGHILRNPFADPVSQTQTHPNQDYGSSPLSPLSPSFRMTDGSNASTDAISKTSRTRGAHIPLFSRNPFIDNRTEDLHEHIPGQYEEGEEDCEDEARMVQARRDTLAALDPANAASSRMAEFNSYARMKQQCQLRKQLEVEQQLQEQEDQERLEEERLCAQEHAPQQDPYHSSDSTLSEEKSYGVNTSMPTVPEIAVRMATPSPPTSSRSSGRQGSSLQSGNGKDGFLSTNYSPSPLSTFSSASDALLSLESSNEDREYNINNDTDAEAQVPTQLPTSKGANRAATVYKSLFQRITTSAFHPSNHQQSPTDGKENEEKEEDPVVDHIGAELERISSKPNRNTFGRLTSSLHQHHRGQKRAKRNTKPKSTSPFEHWDSCDDLMVPDTDDEEMYLKRDHDFNIADTMEEDYASLFGPSESTREHLKGSVGGRRGSDDHVEDYLSHASTKRPQKSLVSRFGRLGGKETARTSNYGDEDAEDWTVHPRTAAIRGTFHRVNDSVSVPISVPFQGRGLERNKSKVKKNSGVRSMRSVSTPASEYTTISLDSPPMPSISSLGGGNSGLSRAGSLDSSFKRMRQTASSFIASFGASAVLTEHEEDNNPFCLEDDDGDDSEKDDSSVPEAATGDPDTAYRSSSFTFGERSSMPISQTPCLQQSKQLDSATTATASTLESIKALLFSTSEQAQLARKASSPASLGQGGATSWALFPPTNYDLRRTQTTSFLEKGGEGLGLSSYVYPSLTSEQYQSATDGSSMDEISFLPIARRKTPAMVPTIVIPQGVPGEQSAQSATRVSFPPKEFERDLKTIRVHTSGGNVEDSDDEAMPDQYGQTNSVAASAMAAAQRARSEGYLNLAEGTDPMLVHSAASTVSQATDDDKSSQFEQIRTHGQGPGRLPSVPLPVAIKTRFPYGRDVGRGGGADSASLSSALFSSTLSTSGSQAATASSSATLLSASATGQDKGNDLKESSSRGRFGMAPYFFGSGALSSTTVAMTPMRTAETNDIEGCQSPTQRQRQMSGQSDTSEKFMQLPEPSRFEGMCSCRGIINITSMLLILCGLVLLILGYPIAASLRKDRLAAENAMTSPTERAAGNGTTVGLVSAMYESANGKVSTASVRDVSRATTLIDPDTPSDQKTRVSKDGQVWNLVFSDEFNQDGRSFRPGQDPFWESMELLPSKGSNSIEHYSHDAVSTKNGHLEIKIQRESVPSVLSKREQRDDDISSHVNGKVHKWRYISGMLQSWNKLCFQGGILEVGVNLPGQPSQPGFKPRVFVLGNLARYGYPATMDGVWPFSSTRQDEIKKDTAGESSELNCTKHLSKPGKQRLDACSNNGVGRGAPEMTLFDAHYGVDLGASSANIQESVLHQRRQLQGGTLIQKQRLSSSTSLRSSRIKSVKDKDAATGKRGVNIASVKMATPMTVQTNDSNVALEVIQEAAPTWIHPLNDQAFESVKTTNDGYEFTRVGLEYWPRSTGSEEGQSSQKTPSSQPYIRFMMDDTWQSPPVEMSDRNYPPAQGHAGQGAHMLPSNIAVPEEPMSIVLKLGMLQDELLLSDNLGFPAVMRVDYVRLYQPPSEGSSTSDSKADIGTLTHDMARLSCNPPDYPTKDYIEKHPKAYQDPSVRTWSEAGYV